MAKTTKPAAGAPRAKKPAGAARKPKAAAPAPMPIEGPIEGGVLKVRSLLERVVARAGADKKQAKAVMDAVLHELGASLNRGEAFILPPLGRAKVTLKGDDETGRKTLIKLRPATGGKAKAKKEGETPLAPAQE